MQLIILCDFDGTVINLDSCEYLLNKFSRKNWKVYDEMLAKGEISLEESMKKQFEGIRITKKLAIKEIEKVIDFRKGFKEFVEYCKRKGFKVIIISAGLDFIIKHFLKKSKINSIQLIAPKVKIKNKKIVFIFPKKFYNDSLDFKEDVVKQYKNKGKKVIYIGNGESDFTAAKKSDFILAIKFSKLYFLCKKEKISFKEINDFFDVINFLKRIKFYNI